MSITPKSANKSTLMAKCWLSTACPPKLPTLPWGAPSRNPLFYQQRVLQQIATVSGVTFQGVVIKSVCHKGAVDKCFRWSRQPAASEGKVGWGTRRGRRAETPHCLLKARCSTLCQPINSSDLHSLANQKFGSAHPVLSKHQTSLTHSKPFPLNWKEVAPSGGYFLLLHQQITTPEYRISLYKCLKTFFPPISSTLTHYNKDDHYYNL